MRPTHATVKLDAIAANYRLACSRAPGSRHLAVIKANELANAYGLDAISTGVAIAFVMECFENGILTVTLPKSEKSLPRRIEVQ